MREGITEHLPLEFNKSAELQIFFTSGKKKSPQGINFLPGVNQFEATTGSD